MAFFVGRFLGYTLITLTALAIFLTLIILVILDLQKGLIALVGLVSHIILLSTDTTLLFIIYMAPNPRRTAADVHRD